MPTPDFEDWLARQDIDIEYTTAKDTYVQHMIDEYGFSGGSVDVLDRFYTERYRGLEEYGIRAVERHYLYRGEPFVETRYGIRGEPGLWGRHSAYVIAEERARAAGDYEVASALETTIREIERYPERYKRIEEELRR